MHDTVGDWVGSTGLHDSQVFGQISVAEPIFSKLSPDAHNLFTFLIFESINKLRNEQVLVCCPDVVSLNANLSLGLSSQALVGDNDGVIVVGHLIPHVNLHTSAGFLYPLSSYSRRQIFS